MGIRFGSEVSEMTKRDVRRCDELVKRKCRHCGNAILVPCPNKIAFAVFMMGDDDKPPVWLCSTHRHACGSGWEDGVLRVTEVRKFKSEWQVRVRGRWIAEWIAASIRLSTTFKDIYFAKGLDEAMKYYDSPEWANDLKK